MKDENINPDGTKRGLENRQVQMIALGGVIGTGLFLGAGTTIAKTGPSILLVYMLMGLFFFLLMRAIGEMLYNDPNQHTFIAFISKYVGDKAGYFSGWTYWIGLVFTAMSELIAVSTYVKFWFPHIPTAIVQIVFLVAIAAVNLIAVKVFGEAEFWFAMIKIIAILALIVTGVFMLFTNFKTPGGHVSVSNITNGFSFFPHGVSGFVGALPMVFFSFMGMEFIGITTAETKNPHHVLPKAINGTLFRIVIFYIGALAVIMTIYPWRSLSASQSPFVQVFSLVGIRAAAAIINFVVLTASASAFNSFLYSSGRHFYQLANDSNGKFMTKFRKISKNGIPARAVIFSAILILIAPALSSFNSITGVFAIISSTTSDLYLIVYALTVVAHYRYRQSADFNAHGFMMPAYKVFDPMLLVFFVVVYGSLFVNGSGTIPAIIGIVWCLGFGFIASREKSTRATATDFSQVNSAYNLHGNKERF